MATINPYLAFAGNCEEAFNFYKSVFGGDFLMVMRFSDAPPGAMGDEMPEAVANQIMHISLPIGDAVLMGSDIVEGMQGQSGVTAGSNFSISVSPDSEEHADRVHNGLAEGGMVLQPMKKQFWGAYFGMCVDKYGFSWMINYEVPQSEGTEVPDSSAMSEG